MPVQPHSGDKVGANQDSVVIQNPSGGPAAKLQISQTVGDALNTLEGRDGFGKGVLQRPDGTILARGSPLEPGVVFVPNVATKGGRISMRRFLNYATSMLR